MKSVDELLDDFNSGDQTRKDAALLGLVGLARNYEREVELGRAHDEGYAAFVMNPADARYAKERGLYPEDQDLRNQWGHGWETGKLEATALGLDQDYMKELVRAELYGASLGRVQDAVRGMIETFAANLDSYRTMVSGLRSREYLPENIIDCMEEEARQWRTRL